MGNCRKLHDDNAKQQYDEAPIANKRRYEDEFLRFCNNMINEVDRKIQKGKQRLQVKGESTPVAPPHVSRVQEQVDKLNEYDILEVIGRSDTYLSSTASLIFADG